MLSKSQNKLWQNVNSGKKIKNIYRRQNGKTIFGYFNVLQSPNAWLNVEEWVFVDKPSAYGVWRMPPM